MLIDRFMAAAEGGAPREVALFWWQGFSSRYHLTSIFDLKNFECREAGAFLLVRREDDGSRTPLFVGTAKSISDDIYDDFGSETMRAIAAGANEVHVHLGSDCDWLCDVMVDDLAKGWSLDAVRPRVSALSPRVFA